MAGRIYHSEEEYKERVTRDNETKKALSSLFTNLGAGLAAGGVVQVYAKGWSEDPYVALWFLVALVLICIGIAFLRVLEAG